jgi:hypothetical protein
MYYRFKFGRCPPTLGRDVSIFNVEPEDEGCKFLRNVGGLLPSRLRGGAMLFSAYLLELTGVFSYIY